MAFFKGKNRNVLILVTVLLSIMIGMVLYSPTLYRMFCALTGFGGTIQRVKAPVEKPGAEEARTMTVAFDANVGDGLPWEFRPLQHEVTVKVGEPKKVYYYAKNNSDKTMAARAVFNVTPYKIAPYFFKIECFCFTDEKLGPGESAKMPLVFYVDKQIEKDVNAQEVRTITLSYTFYKQGDEKLKDARDLKTGSRQEEKQLDKSKQAEFANEAPRK